MELIEIIRSSILLFSLSLVMTVVIAFGLYKIRNQAKSKKLSDFLYLIRKQKKMDDFVDNQLNNLPTSSELKQNTSLLANDRIDRKFIVVNRRLNPGANKNLRVSYHPNIYKFYEEHKSTIMFKIKPDVKINP